MPQQPTVTRMLKIQGAAQHTTNIEGRINPAQVMFYDHFNNKALVWSYKIPNPFGHRGGSFRLVGRDS